MAGVSQAYVTDIEKKLIPSDGRCPYACLVDIIPGITSLEEARQILTDSNISFTECANCSGKTIITITWNEDSFDMFHNLGDYRLPTTIISMDGLVDTIQISINRQSFSVFPYFPPKILASDDTGYYVPLPDLGLVLWTGDANYVTEVILASPDYIQEHFVNNPAYTDIQPCDVSVNGLCGLETLAHPEVKRFSTNGNFVHYWTITENGNVVLDDEDSTVNNVTIVTHPEQVGSVVIAVNGETFIDNTYPYEWDFSSVGEYSISATAYALPDRQGTHGNTYTRTINIIDEATAIELLRDALISEDCEIACINGLEVGVTTNEEIITILEMIEPDYKRTVNTMGGNVFYHYLCGDPTVFPFCSDYLGSSFVLGADYDDPTAVLGSFGSLDNSLSVDAFVLAIGDYLDFAYQYTDDEEEVFGFIFTDLHIVITKRTGRPAYWDIIPWIDSVKEQHAHSPFEACDQFPLVCEYLP